MNIVLLSGGSGKRLWPLSNDIRSKQFIKIFRTEDGQYESMVQRVFRQIRRADPEAAVTIATSRTQVSAIRNQLGENIGISVEPCRRDTFPAIALVTAYLTDVQGVDPEDFNCLFCYCPLYALGEDCGGGFRMLESGVKDCSGCALPHRRENYGKITGAFQRIVDTFRKT